MDVYAIDTGDLRRQLADAERRVEELRQLLDLVEKYGAPQTADPEAEPVVIEPKPLRRLGPREAVRWVLREHPSREWKPEDLMAEMVRLGWETESNDPIQLVRTAVNRLSRETSEVRRVGHGLYAWRASDPSEEEVATP